MILLVKAKVSRITWLQQELHNGNWYAQNRILRQEGFYCNHKVQQPDLSIAISISGFF